MCFFGVFGVKDFQPSGSSGFRGLGFRDLGFRVQGYISDSSILAEMRDLSTLNPKPKPHQLECFPASSWQRSC